MGWKVSIRKRLMANRNRPDSRDTRDITDIRVGGVILEASYVR